MRWGYGRAEDVWPVAQKAVAEVTVAEAGCGRKKKKLQRREKGWKEKRESRGGSLVGVLACYGGDGGGSGWWLERRRERGKKKRLAEERQTFTVSYYRCSGGWPVVLATLGGASCSRRSWRKKW